MDTKPSGKRLEELSRKFLELRDKKRVLEQEVKDAQAEMDQIGLELVPILEGLDAQNIKITGVGTVYLQTVFYVRALKEREDDFVQWLDSHDLGMLAKRTVHHQTLQAAYKEWAEKDLPLPPPELVEAHPEVKVRIRKG